MSANNAVARNGLSIDSGVTVQTNGRSVQIQTGRQRGRRVSRRGRRFRNLQRRGRLRRFNFNVRPVAAGYGYVGNSFVRIQGTGASCVCTCRELFYITKPGTSSCWALPATPTKWLDTRTRTMCMQWSAFRPTSCVVHYVPAVSTGTDGIMTFGTMFADNKLAYSTMSDGGAVNSLPTTNGGFATTVWRPHTSRITLGQTLHQRNFPLSNVDPDDVPFWFVCNLPGTGMLVVDMTMQLVNPASGAQVRFTAPFKPTPVDGHPDQFRIPDSIVKIMTGLKNDQGYWFKYLGGDGNLLRIGENIVSQYLGDNYWQLPFNLISNMAMIYGGPMSAGM